MAKEVLIVLDEFTIEVLSAGWKSKTLYVVPFTGTTSATPEMLTSEFYATYTEVTTYEDSERPRWWPEDNAGEPMWLGIPKPTDPRAPIPPKVALFKFPTATKVNGVALVTSSVKGDKTGEVVAINVFSEEANTPILPTYIQVSLDGQCRSARFGR